VIRAGVATIDITPRAGLPMAGFAARTEPAVGVHDPLTVRAIAVNDTALAAIDVIGIDATMSERIRKRCVLPDDKVVLTAVHNHGGPVSMRARLGVSADEDYLAQLETACVDAIDRAVAHQQPASLHACHGGDPAFARNRRHAGGITDPTVPVLRIHDANGNMLAVLFSYACHPVVLGADNRLWTADYPHFARVALESAYPGAMAMFVTGCCGDVNTGHSAQASVSLIANAARTFEQAERHGRWLAAAAAFASGEIPLGDWAAAANAQVELALKRRERGALPEMAARWQAERTDAGAARAALLDHWITWSQTTALQPLEPVRERVTVLDWGGMPIVAMPGEIFAETSLSIRSGSPGGLPSFILAFADDNPGYIPPASEFRFGGYEVDEAHRFYNRPAGFAPGSAERLADAAIELVAKLSNRARA